MLHREVHLHKQTESIQQVCIHVLDPTVGVTLGQMT